MDDSLFRWINRLANRTGWPHGCFAAYANYGIVLFAALLIASYLGARRPGDLRAVAVSVWAGGAALIALGVGQLIGGTIDRARFLRASCCRRDLTLQGITARVQSSATTSAE